MATSVIKRPLSSDWRSVTNWLSSAERGNAFAIWAGDTICISFMTEIRVHSENDLIMTVPQEWRPSGVVYIPVYAKNTCALLVLNTDGTLKVWISPDSSIGSARLYGSFTYMRYISE